MNRVIDYWRGSTRWNSEFDTDTGLVHRLPAIKSGLDELGLDQEFQPEPMTRTVESIGSLEQVEEVGRYLPLIEGADAVPEAGFSLRRFDLGLQTRLYDMASDEFFVVSRFGDSHRHGPLGTGPGSLDSIEGSPDISPVALSADVNDDLGDVFVSLPDGEMAFALPSEDGMEAFGFNGRGATFGGGDDANWMLTLLPSPDGNIDDAWFGHPAPGSDPWG